MSIWYSISAEFTLQPDCDRHALAATVAEYEEATVPAVRIDDDTATVEAEGDMCRGRPTWLSSRLCRCAAATLPCWWHRASWVR